MSANMSVHVSTHMSIHKFFAISQVSGTSFVDPSSKLQASHNQSCVSGSSVDAGSLTNAVVCDVHAEQVECGAGSVIVGVTAKKLKVTLSQKP